MKKVLLASLMTMSLNNFAFTTMPLNIECDEDIDARVISFQISEEDLLLHEQYKTGTYRAYDEFKYYDDLYSKEVNKADAGYLYLDQVGEGMYSGTYKSGVEYKITHFSIDGGSVVSYGIMGTAVPNGAKNTIEDFTPENTGDYLLFSSNKSVLRDEVNEFITTGENTFNLNLTIKFRTYRGAPIHKVANCKFVTGFIGM